MGRNAVHRLAAVLARLDAYAERRPVLAGCEYREALQAVAVEGGVAGNVVPDRAVLTINHRFAPDRTPATAEAHVREVIGPCLDAGDEIRVVDVADASPPAVDHPLIAALVTRHGLEVTAKLGWTDVARFAAHGIPAANFGPGDATVAHMADERVTRAALERCFVALDDVLRRGA
jgi:succinyl-diaminopimelate desuccinylase